MNWTLHHQTNFALGMSTGRDPVFDNCLSISPTTAMELILSVQLFIVFQSG